MSVTCKDLVDYVKEHMAVPFIIMILMMITMMIMIGEDTLEKRLDQARI